MTHATRGKYFEKARVLSKTIIVDKKVAATLGGAEGVTALERGRIGSIRAGNSGSPRPVVDLGLSALRAASTWKSFRRAKVRGAGGL